MKIFLTIILLFSRSFSSMNHENYFIIAIQPKNGDRNCFFEWIALVVLVLIASVQFIALFS